MWKRKLNINKHLDNWSEPYEIAQSILKEIVDFLDVWGDNDDLTDIADNLRDVDDETNYPQFEYVLSELYDWADSERVWVGD